MGLVSPGGGPVAQILAQQDPGSRPKALPHQSLHGSTGVSLGKTGGLAIGTIHPLLLETGTTTFTGEGGFPFGLHFRF